MIQIKYVKSMYKTYTIEQRRTKLNGKTKREKEDSKEEKSTTGAIAENNGGEITRTNLNKELTSYIR